MVDVNARKSIRRIARKRIVEFGGQILLFMIFIISVAMFFASLAGDIQKLEVPLALVCSFSTVSMFPVFLKFYRGESITSQDAIVHLSPYKGVNYLKAWAIVYGIAFAATVLYGVEFGMFIASVKNYFRGLDNPLLFTMYNFEEVVGVIYKEITIFSIVFIITFIAIYILTIFTQFVYYLVADAKKEAKTMDIVKYSIRMCKNNKLSYCLMILHLIAVLIGLCVAITITFTILTAIDLSGLALYFMFNGLLAGLVIIVYIYLAIAGFYEEMLKNMKDDELTSELFDDEFIMNFFTNEENPGLAIRMEDSYEGVNEVEQELFEHNEEILSETPIIDEDNK